MSRKTKASEKKVERGAAEMGFFSLRVCDAGTGAELKSHAIGEEQRKYFEGRPQQEYHVCVTASQGAFNDIAGWAPGDQITAKIIIDGKKTGSSHSLKVGVERSFDNMIETVAGQTVKRSLVFVEPQLEQFRDEYEAKANVEANKNSPMGSIVCEFWHTRKKAGSQGSGKVHAVQTAKVKDTKKFTDRASIGTQGGRVLGFRAQTTANTNLAKLGERKIWIHTTLMCQYLKGLGLRDNSAAKSSSSSSSSSFSSSSSSSSSAAAPVELIEIPDDVPPPPAIVIEIKDEPDAKRRRGVKTESAVIDLTSDD